LQKQNNNPEKLSWVWFPAKMVSVSRKLSTIEERRQDQVVCFGEGNTGTKATTPKRVLGSSPDEDGFCSSKSKQDRRKIEESQGNICSFRRGDYRNWSHKLENCNEFQSLWRC
jgi:hypothetical protein